MPTKTLVLTVNIRKIGPQKCEVLDHFVATPGSDVEFVFPGMLDADIIFDGPSPFTTPKGRLGKNKVHERKVTKPEQHTFTVTWAGGGQGNGTGEVIPV